MEKIHENFLYFHKTRKHTTCMFPCKLLFSPYFYSPPPPLHHNGKGSIYHILVKLTLTSSLLLGPVQVEHYSRQLEAEQRSVVALRSSLQARETELTRATDQFLQEKVATARAHGELSALRGRLNRYACPQG